MRTARFFQPTWLSFSGRILLGLGALLIPASAARAWADDALPVAEVKHDGPVDFEKEILPILRRNCLACHNATDAESELVLETPQTILKGGSEGPGVVPGKAEESLVFQLASHRRESFMPPEGNGAGAKNLTPEELGLLKLWIDQGAKGKVSGGAGPIAWQPLPPGFNPIYAVAVAPHGRFVAAGRANQIFTYSVPAKRELDRLTDPELLERGIYKKRGVAHLDLVQSLAFGPNGDRLASGGFRTVKIWRRQTGARQNELLAATADIRVLAVSRDHKLAAVAQADGKIQIYDLVARKPLRALAGPTGGVTSIAFSPDGARLAAGSPDQTIRVWNVADGREIGAIKAPSPVAAVAFVLDGKQIVAGGADSIIRSWNVPEGQPPAEGVKPLKEMKGHSAPVVALAPLPNKPSQFVSASLDGTARQWDVGGGNQIRQYSHGAPLTSVAASADGKRIATAAETGVTKLWNAENGQQIAELTGESDARYEIEDINLAIELARRQSQNAKKDLDEASKLKQAEAENADKAAVELVRAEQEAKQKTEAAVKPVADKEAADKELAALKPELPKAEAAKKKADAEQTKATEAFAKAQADQKAKTKIAADADAALKKVQQEKAAADKALADAKAKQKAAQDGGDKSKVDAATAEVKAAEEKVAAADKALKEAEAAKTAADKAKTAADKLVADADAAKKKADEAKQQADKALNEITKKIEAAEKKVAQLDKPAQKAVEEKKAAVGALEAAKRAVELSKEAVARAAAEVPRMQELLNQREREQKAAEARLAQTQRETNSRNGWINDLKGQKAGADRAALDAQNRLRDARAKRDAALTALTDARAKAFKTFDEQAKAVAAANHAVKEATAAKEAADKALADAKAKQKSAQDGGDKAKVDAATAEVKAAEEKKSAAEQALAKATTAAENAKNQANQANAAAQNAVNQAQGQFAAANNALGGAKGIADAAAAYRAQLDKRLADAKAALAAAKDDAAKAAQTAIVEDLTAQQAAAAKAATEAADKAKTTAAAQAAAVKKLADAGAALDAAAVAARKASGDAARLIAEATGAKAAADKAATEAAARDKAAKTAKAAADKALAAAQNKLKQAKDDAAKAVAQVEVKNATENKVEADKEAAEAAAALKAANDAKAAAEKTLADAKAKGKQTQDAANKALADARNAYNDARNKLSQADAAAGGLVAQADTAARLQAAADAALAELRKPALAVAFSPDGAQLAVVGDDGRVRFYASETGEPLHEFAGPGGALLAAAYVGDNRVLTAAADRSLAVWSSVPTWTLERKIGSVDSAGPFIDRVTALDFSPNGELLATGGGAPSRGGELKLWSVETGKLVREIPDAHSDTIFCVQFSPDGKYLATCGADRFMKVFEVETGKLVKAFEGHTHHVLGVDWRADGRLLATCGADKVIKVWDFATGEQIRTIERFDKGITAIEFLGVSDNFVVATGDGKVVTRNTGGGGGPNFAGATDFMYNVRASQDGKTVAAGGQDSVLRVWDQQGKSIVTFEPPPSAQPAADKQAAAEK